MQWHSKKRMRLTNRSAMGWKWRLAHKRAARHRGQQVLGHRESQSSSQTSFCADYRRSLGLWCWSSRAMGGLLLGPLGWLWVISVLGTGHPFLELQDLTQTRSGDVRAVGTKAAVVQDCGMEKTFPRSHRMSKSILSLLVTEPRV